MEDEASKYKEDLKLCEENIKELMRTYQNESDQKLKNHLKKKLEEYLTSAENIKKILKKYFTKRALIEAIYIRDGTTGYSYERIFGKYLTNDIREIEIEEPHLKEIFQLTNLTVFFELLVKKLPNLKSIKLTTQPDKRTQTEQPKCFSSLTEDLEKRKISLHIEFSDVLHFRQITFSNGYMFKIDRGLDYFKCREGRFALGSSDYHFRKCKETQVDIFQCTV